MTAAEQLAERQTLLELLKGNYEIVTGIVRRLATLERIGTSVHVGFESSSLLVDLAGDAIPHLRRRLGLEPDPNLAPLSELFRRIQSQGSCRFSDRTSS